MADSLLTDFPAISIPVVGTDLLCIGRGTTDPVNKVTVAVLFTDPTFINPALGTPASGVATNLTGTAASLTAGKATVLATARTIGGSSFDGSGNVTSFPVPGAIGGTTPAAGAFTTVDASSQITSTVTTGTAPLVIASTTRVSNLNVATAGVADSATAVAVGGITGLGAGVATWLASPSSSNLLAAVTDETGTGALVFATSPGFTTAANPVSNDGAALGTTALGWADLFLATGAVINYANGNVVLTHSSGILTMGTGEMRITTIGTNTASVVSVGGAQNLTAKTLTSPTITTSPTAAGATWTDLGTVTTADINGGTLDGTVIGGASAAAGTFTTLIAGSATSLLLGTAGSAVGSVGFRNATSGTATIAPPTGALGTYQITLPNAASTLPVYGQQITYAGPTAARTVTYPDASFTVARIDAANTFVGASTASAWVLTSPTITTGITPTSNDGAALGSTGNQFSDLFLAEGGVINWDNGDCTLTQVNNTLTVAGAEFIIDAASGPTSTVAGGFRGIPQNSQSAAYTTVLADAGKHIYHPGADTTARIWTIDSNANVACPIGTTHTFVNDTSAGTLTIKITSDTMVLFPGGSTGDRTLTANNIATALKVTATRWVISGSSGLT